MNYKGYLKSSKSAIDLQQAIEGLKAKGVPEENIFISDVPYGIIDNLIQGDVLIIHSFVECGCRSIQEVYKLLQSVAEHQATLQTLCEPIIDTATHVSSWLTAFETITQIEWLCRSERSRKSLASIKRQGKKLGRHITEKTKQQLKTILRNYYLTEKGVKEICQEVGCDSSILYRYINLNNLPRRQQIIEEPELNPFFGGKNFFKIRIDNDFLFIYNDLHLKSPKSSI